MLYLFIIVFILIIIFILNTFKYPLLTESDLSNCSVPWMYLYYASKYLTPVKRAAKGSNLEHYFRSNEAPDNRTTLKDSNEILINTVGDIMIRTEICRGDIIPLWDEIGSLLFSSDITFGNMEFAVNENWLIDKPIRFSMSKQQADVMIKTDNYGKFDIVSLANNHINDSLCDGIQSTRSYLDDNDILHVGANYSTEDMNNFPIIEKKGIKIAFLAYTFSTNGVPLESGCQFGTNLIRFNALDPDNYDPSLIYSHIHKARKEKADIIVASLHWGVEFEYYPPVRIVERGHSLLENGIDVIIGHHPHILNPSEWYRTKDGRDTLCFYSLNGVSTQTLPIVQHNMGQIAGIRVEKGIDTNGEKRTRIKNVEITPTFFLRKGKGSKNSHRILHLYKTVEKLQRGEKIQYLNLFQRICIKYAYREYRKYFEQKSFKYL
jgi:poly-gamma-glutamate capsule biosynthesis protein CapA/YwtB (metallophosphatase superfamily)